MSSVLLLNLYIFLTLLYIRFSHSVEFTARSGANCEKILTSGHFSAIIANDRWSVLYAGDEKMATLAEKKKLDKKLRLLQSARELLTKSGLSAVAVNDVVKAAGVAKGTFYLYFKDKHDLIDQVLIAESRNVVHEAVEALRHKQAAKLFSGAEQFIFFYDYLTDYLIRNKPLVSLVQKNLAACYSWFATCEEEPSCGDLELLLAPLCEKGATSEEARQSLYLMTEMVLGACCNAILHGAPYTAAQIQPQLHKLIRKITT